MIHTVRQPNFLEQLACLLHAVPIGIQLERQQHILQGRKRLDKLVRLKHETDLAPAHGGELRLDHVVNRNAIQPDFPRTGTIQSGQESEQGAFPAAARAHNRHKLASRDGQRNSLQDVHPACAVLDPLLCISNFNHPILSLTKTRHPQLCGPLHVLRNSEAGGFVRLRSCFCFYTVSVDVRRFLIVSFWMLILGVPARAEGRPLLVCFGDSITSGYGLQPGQAYPDALQRKLDRNGYQYRVDNQGTSGATTKDAVAELPSILQLHPEVVLVEFGGNDGLRGLPPDQTRRNLDSVLTGLEN